MSQEIVIDIMPDGTVKVDALGFEDNTCAAATKQIEILLGGHQKRDEKPEYYQPAANIQEIARKL